MLLINYLELAAAFCAGSASAAFLLPATNQTEQPPAPHTIPSVHHVDCGDVSRGYSAIVYCSDTTSPDCHSNPLPENVCRPTGPTLPHWEDAPHWIRWAIEPSDKVAPNDTACLFPDGKLYDWWISLSTKWGQEYPIVPPGRRMARRQVPSGNGTSSVPQRIIGAASLDDVYMNIFVDNAEILYTDSEELECRRKFIALPKRRNI